MIVSLKRAGSALGILLLTTTAVAAQDMKESFLNDFERQRTNVLAYVDAMPDAGLRTAPTEGVRDFAQQIEHIVGGAVNIVGSGVDRSGTDIGDPEVYLNSKAALKDFVNAGFDQVVDMVESATPESLMQEGTLFGSPKTNWKIIKTAYEHGVWTLGATVPYLRLQGATPPGYNVISG
jgi:uncharacterized protein YheU (UPF0270 family)